MPIVHHSDSCCADLFLDQDFGKEYTMQIRGNACLLATAIGCLDYVDAQNPGDAVSFLHSQDSVQESSSFPTQP